MIDERIAAHEAGHCAALVFLGRLPKVVRADNPYGAYSGHLVFDCEDGIDRDMASNWIIATLMGPLCELGRETPWPPPFETLDPADPEDDVAHLAKLARYLRLDRPGYYGHVAVAAHIADCADFKGLHALIASALCRVPVLDADQLRRLIGPRTLAKFHLEEAI